MKKFIIYLLFILALMFIYGKYIEVNNLVIKEKAIINNKIPSSFNGFKIIHISDIHFKNQNNKLLDKTLNKINENNPDLVVITGDLLDKNYSLNDDEINKITDFLNNIQSKLGIFIIKGNHDNINKSFDKVIEKTNITLLNNQNEIIYNGDENGIYLIGTDDYLNGNLDLNETFNNINIEDNIYKILLAHEPDIYDKLEIKPDLLLAGHSHSGQIRLPFIGKIYTPEGAKKYYDEEYILDNTTIYINKGIGTSGYDIRFLAPPTINLYRLYNN